ncbi:MAG: hypothetical protein IBX72_03820 [Nitrospirae bacterium]|jgi:lipid-binding SYLF domain-containing protein|nr:hypothetical protein [Nitrospirota bacterium]
MKLFKKGKYEMQCIMTMLLLCIIFFANGSFAATAKEIEVSVDVALERFVKEVRGGEEFLKVAKGILVIPGIFKAGFIIGGEYGEGALRIGGKTVDYYSIVAGSWGIQIGAQKKDVILIFMQEESLKKFRESPGWKAGVDGSVAIVDVGAGKAVDTTNIKDPIIGFVFGQKGLMVNATIEGSKFTKLDKKE